MEPDAKFCSLCTLGGSETHAVVIGRRFFRTSVQFDLCCTSDLGNPCFVLLSMNPGDLTEVARYRREVKLGDEVQLNDDLT